MAKIAPYFNVQLLDDNGDPLAGGFVFTYEAGTTTNKDTFTTSEGDVANANPVVLDSSGRADIWLDSGAYKFITKDSASVTISEVDNIVGEASNVFASSIVDVSTNTTITTANLNNFMNCTATLTLTLLAASTAGEGFLFVAKNDSDGLVTIDPDGSETIDGIATLVLNPNAWSIIICDGTNWKTLTNNEQKDNLNASVAPVVGDDIADGYGIGSRWLDTTADEAYVCLDASAGAAVWVNTTLETSDLGAAALKGVDTNFSSPTDDNVPTTLAVSDQINGENGFGKNLLHIQHQETAGTNGGSATSGSWQTRTLNTSVTNEITGASLSTNQITLPIGDYYIEAEASANGVVNHTSKLRNITDTADEIIGMASRADSANQTLSTMSGRFTIAGIKAFEIQTQVNTSNAGDGYGDAGNFGVTEIYVDVKIWKV